MQLETVYAAAGALVGALVALYVYHVAVVRPNARRTQELLELHDGLLSADGGSAAGRVAALESSSHAAGSQLTALDTRVRELEALASTDLSRAGFVRYDAFADSGAGLSYALALLNRRGDGVVITSIYSREDSRTFGKAVEGYKPTVAASAEELEAIERARLSAPTNGR